jgi:hypothetical protein
VASGLVAFDERGAGFIDAERPIAEPGEAH